MICRRFSPNATAGLPCRSDRPARGGFAPALGATLVLSLAAGALAATGSPVVPPNGKVAGKGYAYYLERAWQVAFASPPSASPCVILTVGGKQVALINPVGSTNSGSYSYTCSEPAGRPVFVDQLSNECSTFKGDHNGFGTTPSQLEKCTRSMFKGAVGTASVDGKPVTNFQRWITATGVYPIHLAKKNILGSKKLDGRSAAYGYGLLLTGLPRGTHTVESTGVVPAGKFNVKITYTLHVH
jgi:hypothetical protein